MCLVMSEPPVRRHRINATRVEPPVPFRDHDFCATFDDLNVSTIGWGPTVAQAADDLRRRAVQSRLMTPAQAEQAAVDEVVA